MTTGTREPRRGRYAAAPAPLTPARVVPVPDPGRGGTAYLLDRREGRALAVGPSLVICGLGERAVGAAPILRAAALTRVFAGGPDEWAAREDQPLETVS